MYVLQASPSRWERTFGIFVLKPQRVYNVYSSAIHNDMSPARQRDEDEELEGHRRYGYGQRRRTSPCASVVCLEHDS